MVVDEAGRESGRASEIGSIGAEEGLYWPKLRGKICRGPRRSVTSLYKQGLGRYHIKDLEQWTGSTQVHCNLYSVQCSKISGCIELE